MDDMDVDNAPSSAKGGKEKDNGKKRFEVKKVSASRGGLISSDPDETPVERGFSVGMGCDFLPTATCIAV